jgi:hypothetical protein
MNAMKEKFRINYKIPFAVLFFLLFLPIQNYTDGNEVDIKSIG